MRWQAGVTGVLAGAALAVAGCSSGPTGPTGTVAGTYIRVGGLANTPNVPLPGTISFRDGAGSTITLSSDGSGKFSGLLPVGSYTVTAASSLINDGKSACSRPLTARVRGVHDRRSHRDPDPHLRHPLDQPETSIKTEIPSTICGWKSSVLIRSSVIIPGSRAPRRGGG